MKKLKQLKNLLVLIAVIIFVCGGFILARKNHSIVGTWISKDDHNSTWVFKSDNTLLTKYKGTIKDRYFYKVSSSPISQCEISTDINPNLQFLRLKEKNGDEVYCYIIYALNNKHLNISQFGRGGFQIFERQ